MGFVTPDVSLSLSLSLRSLTDSAEEAGTMETDRDCFSKSKKGKYRDIPQVPTFANVDLLMVLAQEEVEAES